MRIAFVCSSSEPGRDGVGDYSRELAAELIAQGHEACLISLADRNVTGIVEELQDAGDISVPALRVPVSVPWPQRVAVARQFMERMGVLWISFQFVPYSYSPKGVIRTALPYLIQFAEGRKVHMMLHELWIGNSMNSVLKHRFVGALQRHYVMRLIRKLAPAAVHTSNPVYAAFLAREGISAGILPLFGNIPVHADAGAGEVLRLFRKQGVDLSLPERGAHWVGGIFGSIVREWTPEPFFGELETAAIREKKTVVIVGMGRFGEVGDRIWADVVQTYAGRFRFVLLGLLHAETLSHIFRILNFGVSMTPWRAFGKSSTGASMTDHGIPMIVTRDDWRPRPPIEVEFNYSPLVRRFDSALMNDFASFLATKREPRSTRPDVARRFVQSLFAS